MAYAAYIGWKNLDCQNANPLAMVFCGPLTHLLLISICVSYWLERILNAGGRWFYSLRCAYEDWKKANEQ